MSWEKLKGVRLRYRLAISAVLAVALTMGAAAAVFNYVLGGRVASEARNAIEIVMGWSEGDSYDVRNAYVSINGSSILSTRTEGMIAVGTVEHEINGEDINRVEDVAVSGRIPANRDVLDVVPLEYALDGQGGIKDPLGMSGARLEMRACVVSALTPNCENLKKATAAADVHADRLVPSVIAAAKAVLTDRQKENGVAVIFVGEDLDVLLELCDRIMVICGGRVTGVLDGRTAKKEEVGLLMTKAKGGEQHGE